MRKGESTEPSAIHPCESVFIRGKKHPACALISGSAQQLPGAFHPSPLTPGPSPLPGVRGQTPLIFKLLTPASGYFNRA